MATKKRKPKQVRVLRIDRAIWHRGMGGAGSSLLTPMGTQCCLGFYARALGYKKAEIVDIDSPETLVGTWGEGGFDNLFPETVLDRGAATPLNTLWVTAAILTNDDSTISDRDREKELKAHFAKIGIKLVFHGKTSKKIKDLQAGDSGVKKPKLKPKVAVTVKFLVNPNSNKDLSTPEGVLDYVEDMIRGDRDWPDDVVISAKGARRTVDPNDDLEDPCSW